jgi:hypothetical protein
VTSQKTAYQPGDVEWVEETGEVFIHARAWCVKCGDRSVRYMDDHITEDGTWTCIRPAGDCCDDGPTGHTQQEHHDASPCYYSACGFDHPRGGPFDPESDAAAKPEGGEPRG